MVLQKNIILFFAHTYGQERACIGMRAKYELLWGGVGAGVHLLPALVSASLRSDSHNCCPLLAVRQHTPYSDNCLVIQC